MQNYRDLEVWNRSHELTLDLYRDTATFPSAEKFGSTSQIRRCSASIGANIAEGCGRKSNGEMQRFLEIASGSASELDYHILLARDLGFLPAARYEEVVSALEILRRKLTALINRVAETRTTKNQQPTTKNQYSKC